MGGHSNTVFVVRASEVVHDYVHDYGHGHVSEDVDVSATTTPLATIKSKPTSTSTSTSISISTFSVRLHLIRHGETEANRNNLVLGQTDSPLTQEGIDQAKAANRFLDTDTDTDTGIDTHTDTITGIDQFWKLYTSDLKRCQTTARLILGLQDDGLEITDSDDNVLQSSSCQYDDNNMNQENIDQQQQQPPQQQQQQQNNNNCKNDENHPNKNSNNNNDYLIVDKRLRERAKGVREGRDKNLTYDEAMRLFHDERKSSSSSSSSNEYEYENDNEYENNNESNTWKQNIPLLELEDEVWTRVRDWIEDIVKDAYMHYLKYGSSGSSSSSSSSNNKNNNSQYDIFAVTHSGTLRIMIERMVGRQLPDDVNREETDKDGKKVGRLVVPNTSITRIDIYPDVTHLNNAINKNDDEDEIDNDNNDKNENENGETLSINVKFGYEGSSSWRAKLIDLTNTLHLVDDEDDDDDDDDGDVQ